MDCEVSPGPTFRFGVFELDLRARQLRKNGRRIHLQDHSLKILATLLERTGEVVTRQDLQAKLWPDGTVADFENGLNAAMGKLRRALSESAEHPHYIETIPRQGYRFLMKAELVQAPASVVEVTAEVAPVPRTNWPRKWQLVACISAAVILLGTVFTGWQFRIPQPAPTPGCTL